MSEIKKPKTSDKKRVLSTFIAGTSVDGESAAAFVRFSASRQGSSYSVLLPMSKEAYMRIGPSGAGSMHKALRSGLVGKGRYEFIMLTRPYEGNAKDGRGKTYDEEICGAHCVPSRNYCDCDWSTELGRAVDSNAAIVHVHPATGELDVIAFPGERYGMIQDFVKSIEELESIDVFTTFDCGSYNVSVASISGNEVIFNLFNKEPGRPGRL